MRPKIIMSRPQAPQTVLFLRNPNSHWFLLTIVEVGPTLPFVPVCRALPEYLSQSKERTYVSWLPLHFDFTKDSRSSATFYRSKTSHLEEAMRLKTISVVALCCVIFSAVPEAQNPPPGTSTGQAIGNGVKGFLNTVFPTGTSILTLVQSWLTKKLSGDQQNQLKTAADAQRAKAGGAPAKDDKLPTANINELQNAANTLKLVSVVLYHTNRAAVEINAMLAVLDTTPGKLPFAQLGKHWDNAEGDLTALKQDNTLRDTRSSVTDISVSSALQALDGVTTTAAGPLKTIEANMKPDGDRSILREELKNVLDITVEFNNVGVLLLGSTGTEVTRAIADFKAAGGASPLDAETEVAIGGAKDALKQLQK
jgi:hypothetical protein